MAAMNHTPLLQDVHTNSTLPNCYQTCSGESSVLPVSNGGEFTDPKEQNRTNRGFSNRQPSSDSGFGCALDTITEQQECCCHHHDHNTLIKEIVPPVRNSPTATFQTSRSESEVSIQCENARPFREDTNATENQHLSQCNGCNCSHDPMFQHVVQPSNNPSIPQRNSRMRSKSESCAVVISTGVPLQSRRSDISFDIPSCSSGNGEYDVVGNATCEHGVTKEHTSSSRKCILFKITAGVIFVIVLIAVPVLLYQIRYVDMKNMEDQILFLEESLKKINQTPPSFSPIIGGVNDNGVRPHAHLILLSEKNIPVDRFNKKILQWTLGKGHKKKDYESSLSYNNKSRCLTVQEQGMYFVYNQIYIVRSLAEDIKNMNHVSNHTLLHIIYRKPFNFPTYRQPYIISESALTHCWSENANTQIHTSYQGIVVELQRGDQLIVGLENYNEKIDNLRDTSTFFGAFKL